MSSVSRVLGRATICTAVCVLIAPIAFADVVASADRQFGRLIKIDAQTVSIRPGCDENAAPRDLPWSEVRYVILDGQCDSHPVVPPVAGLASCKGGELLVVYQVKFAAGQSIDASEVAFDGTWLRAKRLTGEWVVENRSAVYHIAKSRRCQTAESHDSWPVTACVERQQWAVNWSPSPVADNRIFTRGFAIHVTWDGTTEEQSGVSGEDVRLAFQSAITLWTSALLVHRKELDAGLAAYVDSVTAQGTNTRLLVAPQVIRVTCPQFAMAVVNVSTDRKWFPDPAVIARSQVEGRTVLLNAANFKFFSRLAPRAEDPPFNLIAVMTHELGHAFGLLDEDGPVEESVMAGVQSDLRRMRDPTAADVRRFVGKLKESITGANPGEFNAVRCAGLRVTAR